MKLSKNELIDFIKEHIPDKSYIDIECETESSTNNIVPELYNDPRGTISTDNYGRFIINAKYYYHEQIL